MGKHLPQGVLAVAFVALALGLAYSAAAARHLDQLWLVPVALAFSAIGMLGVAVAIKLREFATRLAALEHGLPERSQTGR